MQNYLFRIILNNKQYYFLLLKIRQPHCILKPSNIQLSHNLLAANSLEEIIEAIAFTS